MKGFIRVPYAGLLDSARCDGVILGRALRLIWQGVPRQAALYAAFMLLAAILPAASISLLKLIIDTVAGATRGPAPPGGTAHTALLLAGSYLLLVGVQQSVGAMARLLHGHIHDLLVGHVTMRVMEKASTYPDLTPFESPRFHDRLHVLQEDVAWRPMSLFTGLAQALQASVTLLFMLIFLARFHPALVLVLALAAGPGLLFQRRLQSALWFGLLAVLPLQRQLAEYTRILITAPFAKEVRLFGLADYLLGRYREQFGQMVAQVRRTRARLAIGAVGLSFVGAIGMGGAFAYVIDQALRGQLTLGDLTLYTGALLQASGAASGLTAAVAQVHETLPFLRELFGFLDNSPAPSPVPAFPAASPPPVRPLWSGQGFQFERVAFGYPDAEHMVFASLSLNIPWGKTTALVGENGAGKSTLVKLLTRLYDPAAGRILLNGKDLRDYDREELRRQVTVVFQDFCRYPLSAWENIGLGDVSRLDDRQRIREAARDAGADGVLRRLPHGEETLLTKAFEGGVDLSGGEWQKIALARAFMRDAPILVLDEPTAALDARSEYELYRRFIELAAGRTTLLISHRFSTVRMADRILVLEGGAVIEEGDHHSLIASGGRYAELYTMQAERYQS